MFAYFTHSKKSSQYYFNSVIFFCQLKKTFDCISGVELSLCDFVSQHRLLSSHSLSSLFLADNLSHKFAKCSFGDYSSAVGLCKTVVDKGTAVIGYRKSLLAASIA